MNENVKISIIVPVYNVEKYLKQCVDSVLNQTYKNFELILVDDGSTDSSGMICDEYAKNDTRIQVIHKENGGLSSAREAGVKCVKGTFSMFLDGDDWLLDDTLEKCVNVIDTIINVDCVMFSYAKELPNKSIDMHILNESHLFSGDEVKLKIYRRLFGLIGEELAYPERMENIVSCCMKMYKSEFIKQGRYYDTKIVGSCEDGLFNMYAMYNMKKIYYIDEPLYRYRKSGISATSTYRPQLNQQWNKLFSIMESIIKEKDLSKIYSDSLNNRIALSVVSIGLNYLDSGFFHFMRVMRKYLRSDTYVNSISQLDVSMMPYAWKVFMVCCRYKCSLLLYFGLRIVNVIKGW